MVPCFPAGAGTREIGSKRKGKRGKKNSLKENATKKSPWQSRKLDHCAMPFCVVFVLVAIGVHLVFLFFCFFVRKVNGHHPRASFHL